MVFALCYCYCADRTHIWNKAQKQYTEKHFMSLCFFTLVLGFLSIRRSLLRPSPARDQLSRQNVSDQPLLSRDQTDEWKGWMQLIILIYHYTGASRALGVYQTIRVLVASYVFMTGFGHTIYFYEKKDYSLRRCASTLIRLNMLSCMLSYVMKTDYLFYYFAPLITFWYMVIYTTMAIGSSENHFIPFLFGKIITSAAIINLIIRVPLVFEVMFEYLGQYCNIHWDVHEWRFRLQLDSYIVYTGMLCGVMFAEITNALRTENDNGTNSNSRLRNQFPKIRRMALLFALVTPVLFYFCMIEFDSKATFNAYVPYISSFPVLSFIILRNYSRRARNFHSSIFAWVGRHSLETFTLQFHVWLAADTKGLLSTGIFDSFGGRRADFILLSILFLWMCWHVAAATQTITAWIIDPSAEWEKQDLKAENKGLTESLPLTMNIETPTTQSWTNGNGRRFPAGFVRAASWAQQTFVSDLRVRLGLIVVVLWVLNMVKPILFLSIYTC